MREDEGGCEQNHAGVVDPLVDPKRRVVAVSFPRRGCVVEPRRPTHSEYTKTSSRSAGFHRAGALVCFITEKIQNIEEFCRPSLYFNSSHPARPTFPRMPFSDLPDDDSYSCSVRIELLLTNTQPGL